MATQTAVDEHVDNDLHEIAATFYTEYLIVEAALTSSEFRMTDHLNSSVPLVDIRASSVQRRSTGAHMNLEGTCGPITKAHVLFVVPVSEPEHGTDKHGAEWKKSLAHDCWMAVGAYSIAGKVHNHVVKDSRLAVRSLDKQFFPMTDATVTFPSGDRHRYPVVIVNRQRVELIAVDDRSIVGPTMAGRPGWK